MIKGTLLVAVSLIVATSCIAVAQEYKFRFSTIYGDHMVLQQAPHMAVVWGYVPNCQKVTVMFSGKAMDAVIEQFRADKTVCKWKVSLPATPGGSNAYTVMAESSSTQISLQDVLFGDVWLCSGQSNMQFTVPQAFNATAEIAAAANYPMIRLFTAALQSSSTPVDELIAIEQNWTVAAPKTVGGSAWGFFSATCWFFGRDLFDKVKYPIGLVDTDWGGTPVEAWSSPDALAKCKNVTKPASNQQLESAMHKKSLTAGPDPHTPSVLWNAMIVPFLNMTIKGAIWYQGEANAGAPQTYHCTFPAMIDDWRAKWYMSTGGATDEKMGFGFVQLAPTGNNNQSSTGFPDIRWAQTADYGYVPNTRLQNVFMAVAIDLGDPTSPFGSVHPRYKQDVGDRLSRAGMAVVYGDKTVDYRGPIATSASISSQDSGLIKVSVKYDSKNPLELRYPYGFELGCVNGAENNTWIEGTATAVDMMQSYAEFPSCPTGYTAMMVRYCWRTDPCTYKKCPIYAKDLPSPPFMLKFM